MKLESATYAFNRGTVHSVRAGADALRDKNGNAFMWTGVVIISGKPGQLVTGHNEAPSEQQARRMIRGAEDHYRTEAGRNAAAKRLADAIRGPVVAETPID